MFPRMPVGRRPARIAFVIALVGLALLAIRIGQRDLIDAVALILIAVVLVFAALAEWPEVDRVLRSRESDVYAVDRLEKMATDEAPPPAQDF